MKKERKIRADVQENGQKENMSKNDFFEAVAGVTVTKETKKETKDKMVSLTPPAPLQKSIDEIVKYKKIEKEAKAERESRETDVIDWVKERQDTDGIAGSFQKSYRVHGKEELITYVSRDAFSSIKADAMDGLKEIFGANLNDYIATKKTVTMNPEVFSKEELQKELMTYIPKDRFSAFFTGVTEYKTIEDFDKKIFDFVKKLANPKKMLERIREFVNQTKPSLK